jgi:hypothetical protein
LHDRLTAYREVTLVPVAAYWSPAFGIFEPLLHLKYLLSRRNRAFEAKIRAGSSRWLRYHHFLSPQV